MAWPEKEMAERMVDYYRLWFHDRMDMPVQEYNDRYAFWNDKFGHGYRACKDFIWSTFNYRITVFGPYIPDRYAVDRLIELYGEMWKFRSHREKTDDKKIKKLMHRHVLLRDEFASGEPSGQFIVEIMSGKCCDACNKYDGSTWWYYGEKGVCKTEPLPFEFCSRVGGCNCCYHMTTKQNADRMGIDLNNVKYWE